MREQEHLRGAMNWSKWKPEIAIQCRVSSSPASNSGFLPPPGPASPSHLLPLRPWPTSLQKFLILVHAAWRPVNEKLSEL